MMWIPDFDLISTSFQSPITCKEHSLPVTAAKFILSLKIKTIMKKFLLMPAALLGIFMIS
jgi:hypothetical protein